MILPTLALLLSCGQPEDSGSDLDPATVIDDQAAIVLSPSGGGGSTTEHFDGEHVEEDCPTDCTRNSGPVLDEAVYLVDGVLRTSPPSIAGQRTAVVIGFFDTDCNLACGAQTWSASVLGEIEGSIGSLPSNLPCDSASSGVYLGFDLGAVQAGEYAYSLRAEDVCGAQADWINLTFEVGDR